jgi:hypothetical protein
MVKNDRDGRTFAAALVKTLPRCGPVTHLLSPDRAMSINVPSQKERICMYSVHLALGI